MTKLNSINCIKSKKFKKNRMSKKMKGGMQLFSKKKPSTSPEIDRKEEIKKFLDIAEENNKKNGITFDSVKKARELLKVDKPQPLKTPVLSFNQQEEKLFQDGQNIYDAKELIKYVEHIEQAKID
jgi:hypothetical protein